MPRAASVPCGLGDNAGAAQDARAAESARRCFPLLRSSPIPRWPRRNPTFVPFALLYMGEPVKLDYLWAALCLMGAVYFIFR